MITKIAVTRVMTKRYSSLVKAIGIERVTYSLLIDITNLVEHEHKNRKLIDYWESNRKVTLLEETGLTKKVDNSEDYIDFGFMRENINVMDQN